MARVFEIAFNIAARLGSGFSNAFGSAGDAIRDVNTRITSLRGELRALDASYRAGGMSAEEFRRRQAALNDELDRTRQSQERLTRIQQTRNRVSSVNSAAGGTFAKATAVGAGVVGLPVSSAIGFDSEMAGVAKQVQGARADSGELTGIYYEARDNIMKASNDMMIMPDSMAKAYKMASKSGVQGMENIDRFARMGIMMGNAFETPAEEVTEQFAKIGNAIGINLETKEGIDRLERLADTVNYLDDRSNASGSDIINVLKRISGTAASLLPTMSDTTLAGISTAMLEMGETSETAGTAINALFTKIAAAPTQSKSFQGALAKVGLSAEELQAGALQDAEGTMLNLFERIGQLDEATKNNFLAELIGNEHIDSISKISGNYGKFVEIIKAGNSEAAKGSMAKEFAIQAETSQRKIEGMQAAAARTAIAFGTLLLPEVNNLTKSLSTAGNWLFNMAKESDGVAATAFKMTAGLIAGTVALSGLVYITTAVIGPLVGFYGWAVRINLVTKLWTAAQWAWNTAMGVGRILLSVGMMVAYGAWMVVATTATYAWTAAQWLWNAAMTANPIGLIIVGIGGLVAAGYWLVQNWQTVQDYWTTFWDNPSAALQSFIYGIYSRFGGAINWMSEKWASVKNMFSAGGAGGNGADMAGIPAYANGTIATSPHIGLFAEKGPEAVIPINDSARAHSLLEQTNRMMGVSSSGGGTVINANFAPVINGGNSSEIQPILKEAQEDFFANLNGVIQQERRLSYG
ncbi:phage tail tape measure protein [Pelosinus baikalensis]|uniref:Phage tail tape measure protein n=1 Tax=Pelosinus baikalensis TaxID=2892015 RepID=A0ABS8HXD2_9FIRM|nr:phage tail tape measure protein [Pelosinus baikalensis]MCC5467622.1 phage tail tape measure protein [Pelosinus baikalensis]